MKSIPADRLGVEQGDVLLFSDFENDGAMWTGDGLRECRTEVRFSQAFSGIPFVTVSLSMWDFSNAANIRAEILAEEITASGFTIVFRTWNDTRVARVRASWQALGAVPDDELWDI